MSSENILQSMSFDEMSQFYRRFMQIIAILPFDGRNYSSLSSRGLLAFLLVSTIIDGSAYVSYAINACLKGVPTIDTICEMMITVGYIVRYYLLLWRRQELVEVLEECRAIWQMCDDDGRQAVRDFERKVRLLFKWLLGVLVSGNLMYSLTAISLTLEARQNNNTHTKYLPFGWFAEGGEDFWPGYEINFLMEVIIGVAAGVILTIVDTVGPFFIMIGAGYFRALQLRLHGTYNKVMLENDDDIADYELVNCIKLHQCILSYCSKIDKITRSLFFVQLLATVYNLSLIGIKLVGMDQDKYKYVLVAFINIGQLFLCQWAPDHLIQESAAIATTAYDVSLLWIRRRMSKLLVLMIARAQRPVQMTAAGVVYLSLETFGEMLKAAASFFAVLRRVTV